MVPEVVEIAIAPRTEADQERLALALSRLALEDPSFRATRNRESGQTIITGIGERHVEKLVDRLQREFSVEIEVGAPQVAYREILASPVHVDHAHKGVSGNTGEFGRVKVQVVPGERGSGVQFFDEIKGGNIPPEFVPFVEKGMREAAGTGPLVGFPIIDFEFHLIDGAYHDTDSSRRAFEIAGRDAMREAAQRAGTHLREPIMNIEVVTPEQFVHEVIAVLSNRCAQIEGTNPRTDAQVVTASAPMMRLFGLERELKSRTDGQAIVEIAWDRYELVNPNYTDPDDSFPAAAALRA